MQSLHRLNGPLPRAAEVRSPGMHSRGVPRPELQGSGLSLAGATPIRISFAVKSASPMSAWMAQGTAHGIPEPGRWIREAAPGCPEGQPPAQTSRARMALDHLSKLPNREMEGVQLSW